jgi:hypothetical protein
MTKTSIFGQSEVKQEEKKPIEFVKVLGANNEFRDSKITPESWCNVMLLQKNYNADLLDLIWAYDKDPNLGCLYLGHWNDGIV